ncbi:uncharacterized protein LOC117326565 [Pecten maximus]|uniref:uncharacterized protein LOC117326565 n=1 Tax=Pecten maximus TaxID=6579 RepID=UPI0014589858|nr:uncharacterized protein LOC117326565 [Pecten maximus]
MDDRPQDTLKAYESGACNTRYDPKEDTEVKKVCDNTAVTTEFVEGAELRPHNEVIKLQNQSNLNFTSKGTGPNLIGNKNTVVFNISGDTNIGEDRPPHTTVKSDSDEHSCRNERSQFTLEMSDRSDDLPSNNQKQFTKPTTDPGLSSSRVSQAPCSTGTEDNSNYTIIYDRKGETMEKPDRSDDSSSQDVQSDTKTACEHGYNSSSQNTIETFESGACHTRNGQTEDTRVKNVCDNTTVSEVDEGAVLRPHNELIQLQNQSNLHFTSKGAGPNVIGNNTTFIYNVNDNDEVNTDNQRWIKEQRQMMKDFLCDISAGHQQRMKEHEEMMMSSIKKNENVDLTEQQNIIGQTENWIQEQRTASDFVTTKAYAVAKEKIKEKRFVVIRGDSGAGKTRLAIQLLDWLHSREEKQRKKPLRLPSLQSWDKVISANTKLAILLDDLLGYSSDVSKDLTWWKQHADVIKSIVVGQESANCLIITLRNDIYHEYKSKFRGLSLFDEENVIDISSPEFIIKEERESLVNVYTSKIHNFEPFSESEISEIIHSSPPIGFPECCRIFQMTPELHSEGVGYFRKPLQSIKTVIKDKFNVAKQTALLYLLLSREPVSTKRLDFENECFDEEGVSHVFRVSSDVFPHSDQNTESNTTQPRCIRQGLDVLHGSFVSKVNGIYSFFHDSIRDTIAILYGEEKPSGFLKYCPSSCLHYVVTNKCKDVLMKVEIEEDIYDIAYQRIVKELQSKQHSSYLAVASMSFLWNDRAFLSRFFQWFNSNGYLSEDYFFRWETNMPLLIPSDLKPGMLTPLDIEDIIEENPSCFLIYAAKVNSFHLFRNLVDNLKIEQLTNHMKYALDVAIAEGNIECSAYLLNKNIQPDIKSCYCAARGGKIEGMRMLAKSISPLTNGEKFDILCTACVYERYEICAYLLKLFPVLLSQKDGADRHLLHVFAESSSIQCFQLVANLVTQDCQGKEQKDLCIRTLKDNLGRTVLHSAYLNVNRQMMLYLMKQYPFLLTQKDSNGVHCLMLILSHFKLGILTAKDIESVIKSIYKDKMMESLIDEDGNTVLHLACLYGFAELCIKLIPACRSLLSYKNNNGDHCLHLIASSGNVTCFESLIACGRHSLHLIAQSGKIECFRSIVPLALKDQSKTESEHFMTTLVDVNASTVLHHACATGQTDMCLYLIREYPELFNQNDRCGRHSLHLIAQSGKIECFRSIVSLALKDKSKTEREHFMTTLVDVNASTVLHQASASGQTDMCLYLIKTYPELLNQNVRCGHHSLHIIARFGKVECFRSIALLALKDKSKTESEQFMATLVDVNASTVLHHACETGQTDMCKYLIREYPELFNQKDRYGRHSLHSIAQSGKVECFQSVVVLALKEKAKAEHGELMKTLTSNDGKSVLHQACVTGNIDMCLYLTKEFQSLLHQKGPLGSHCLHLTAASGDVNCFKLVTQLALWAKTKGESTGVMESLADDYGHTVLHHACVKGHTEMCVYLISEYPSLLSKKNRYGSHSLHLVAKSGNVDCFKTVSGLLLKDKTESERISFLETLINNNGKTVLHKACVKRKREMCLYLIREMPSLLNKLSRSGKYSLEYIPLLEERLSYLFDEGKLL